MWEYTSAGIKDAMLACFCGSRKDLPLGGVLPPARLSSDAKARAEGKSVANYVRSRLGLPDRDAGRPTVSQLEVEQDQAWEILRSLGLEPTAYFPPRGLPTASRTETAP
jgi:hypothetical protein